MAAVADRHRGGRAPAAGVARRVRARLADRHRARTHRPARLRRRRTADPGSRRAPAPRRRGRNRPGRNTFGPSGSGAARPRSRARIGTRHRGHPAPTPPGRHRRRHRPFRAHGPAHDPSRPPSRPGAVGPRLSDQIPERATDPVARMHNSDLPGVLAERLRPTPQRVSALACRECAQSGRKARSASGSAASVMISVSTARTVAICSGPTRAASRRS